MPAPKDNKVNVEETIDEIYDVYIAAYEEDDTLDRTLIRLHNIVDDLENYQRNNKK